MKKIIITLSLAVFLTTSSANAQAPQVLNTQENINFQLISSLKQVIALLIQQVEELTRQLKEQQANLGAITEQPVFVPIPTLPKGIDVASNKDLREGIVYPSVKLQVQVVRWKTDRNQLNNSNFWEEDVKNGIAEIMINRPNKMSDKIRVLYSVGNPDYNFTPPFTCLKTGDWEGDIAPNDHWEDNIRVVQDSTLGVKCRMNDGSYESIDTFKVIVNK